jgi:hypothetical protein
MPDNLGRGERFVGENPIGAAGCDMSARTAREQAVERVRKP